MKICSFFPLWRLGWIAGQAKNKTLNEDTYLTFNHILKVIVEVAKYLIETLKFDFVLLGCFQTDNLESRFGQFGQYANMSNVWRKQIDFCTRTYRKRQKA